MANRYLNLRQAVADAAAFLAEMRHETIECPRDYTERVTIRSGRPPEESRIGSV